MGDNFLDPIHVRRTFRLCGARPAFVLSAVVGKDGVDEAVLTDGVLTLDIRYDLRHVRFDDIERVLDAAGRRRSANPFVRLRRFLIPIFEENAVASILAPIRPCCSQPPSESGGGTGDPPG